jgi:hypothetical protein
MALTQWGTGGFFLKPAATLPLIKIYRMSLISTGSISLDSTFKVMQIRNSGRIMRIRIIRESRIRIRIRVKRGTYTVLIGYITLVYGTFNRYRIEVFIFFLSAPQ